MEAQGKHVICSLDLYEKTNERGGPATTLRLSNLLLCRFGFVVLCELVVLRSQRLRLLGFLSVELREIAVVTRTVAGNALLRLDSCGLRCEIIRLCREFLRLRLQILRFVPVVRCQPFLVRRRLGRRQQCFQFLLADARRNLCWRSHLQSTSQQNQGNSG